MVLIGVWVKSQTSRSDCIFWEKREVQSWKTSDLLSDPICAVYEALRIVHLRSLLGVHMRFESDFPSKWTRRIREKMSLSTVYKALCKVFGRCYVHMTAFHKDFVKLEHFQIFYIKPHNLNFSFFVLSSFPWFQKPPFLQNFVPSLPTPFLNGNKNRKNLRNESCETTKGTSLKPTVSVCTTQNILQYCVPGFLKRWCNTC